MSEYLRAIIQKRWHRLNWMSEDDIQGDAFLDLQTTNNKLSIFKVVNPSDTERIAVAIAAKRSNFSVFDYVVFSDDALIEADVVIRQTVGQTPDTEANKLHHAIQELNANKLTLLAKVISDNTLERLLAGEMEEKLRVAFNRGDLKPEEVNPKLLLKLEEEHC